MTKQPVDIRVVTEVTGEPRIVDYSQRVIVQYSNKDQEILYRVYDRSDEEQPFVAFTETGTVDTVEERMSCTNNPVKFAYLTYLGLADDSEQLLWHQIVAYVDAHQEQFFDADGDIDYGMKLTQADIAQILQG
ncbi:hypothetical protein IV38_GL000560 [Lactobacillus selangorensis]|uniref:Uncharacterized protein n=1 Tax=Lactobacillus selangorensis TaxID=81857 RepID=A0A0R2G2R8_9LACO|nr:hypothetical protein [Lactobacillus selangorensis]KRN29673.1 hypothetical protein IV38_GL000560 [Lactobacillus selangorensis]KRN33798.1 hypothetical protein IV40_GL000108 [Lactobacillus selangorensis]